MSHAASEPDDDRADSSQADTSRRHIRPLPTSIAVTAGILLAVPVLAVLLVPIYSRATPEIGGWPFFYWWQVAWVVLCPIFTTSAAVLITRARRRAGQR